MYATRRRFYDRSVPNQSGTEAATMSAGAHAPLRKADGSSRFDQMATGSALVSLPRQAMLGVLLDATLACARAGRPVLKPLWVDEAMQRAYNMVRLTAELERQSPSSRGDPLGAAAEYRVAMELAEAFRSLAAGDDEEVLPCSDALRTIVRDMVDLFGPMVGQVRLCTSIERLTLPAFKRRALALAACELVINALRHGFVGRGVGNIAVMLRRTGRGHARFSVADDGCGIPGSRYPQPCGIVSDLAALLGTDVFYGATDNGGTLVEISIPLSD
jgi:two-component sensor histidine kinase